MYRLGIGMVVLAGLLLHGCKGGDEVTTTTVSIRDYSTTEGTGANTTFRVPLQFAEATTTEIVVSYQTTDGSAKSGEDFQGGTGTVTIPIGATESAVEIVVISDSLREPEEDFQVVLTSVAGGKVGTSFAKVSIKNDDTNFPITDVGYTTPLSYAGKTLVWQDEFSGTSLDASAWTHETGNSGWGNNELQYYKSENTAVQQGYLVIEARKENFGTAPYTSSRIVTLNKKSFKYGRIDIRAKLPEGKGVWPALWMLGQNISTVNWPACGEIDIMEIIGSEPNKLHGTAHWADANGQRAQYGGSTTLPSGKFADKFHVFSIVWNASSITWYLDDVQYHVIDINPSDLNEFKLDFFFIFNVAVGGTWPGSPDGTTVFPQVMLVDYVRVFQ